MIALHRLASSLWLIAIFPSAARSQQYDPSLFADLHWRPIGPFRGGRTVAATGVRGQPNLFYIGVNNGGVWRTTDYGRTGDRLDRRARGRSLRSQRHLRRQR